MCAPTQPQPAESLLVGSRGLFTLLRNLLSIVPRMSAVSRVNMECKTVNHQTVLSSVSTHLPCEIQQTDVKRIVLVAYRRCVRG